MKKVLSLIMLLGAFSLFAELFAAGDCGQQPVSITNCRSFPLRGDEESKTGLASRYAQVESDCDSGNKVCLNIIKSAEGTIGGGNGIFTIAAFYPKGESYEHFVMFKVFPNKPEKATELWMATNKNFDKSTYAIAISDEDKEAPLRLFANAKLDESIVPTLLYSFGDDWNGDKETLEFRKNYDLGLLKIFEAIVGGTEGYTADFIKSEDWLDLNKRDAALKILRDYTLAHLSNINFTFGDSKDFADYLLSYSKQYETRLNQDAEINKDRANASRTFLLDEASFKAAKKLVEENKKYKKTEKAFKEAQKGTVIEFTTTCYTDKCVTTSKIIEPEEKSDK